MGPRSRVVLACSGLLACLVLTSCNGGTSSQPAADFSLSSTPATLTLVPGGAGQQVSVTATPVNGFAGKVSVAMTGLPANVTAQPSTLSLVPGTPQSVTITAGAAAAAASASITLTGTAGTLSHSATIAATVAPPPAFSLALTPAAVTITGGAAGASISVLATAVNGFNSTVAVTLAGLPNGVTASPATLNLTPGTAQSVTLTAATGVPPIAGFVMFNGSAGTLTHSASLALTVSITRLTVAPNVTTYHYNVARNGLNPLETTLTPGNVNSAQFGKVGFDTVDGKVDAEPLFVPNLIIGGLLHNTLFVASEHGSVYAFDADNGAQLWKTSVIPAGETTSDDHNCSQITSEIGITSTPVIDRVSTAHGTIFTVGMSKDAAGAYHQRLHALDLLTGAELTGSPTEVAASVPGTGDNSQNGNVVFDPSQYAERAALLLLNGNIYTSWTSHCDIGLYTGWVMAYDETTLKQTQVLNLTPNGRMGSVWMSGSGPAADAGGNIYLLDANGTFDTPDGTGFPANGDYGNAMLRLTTTGGKLAVGDYFEAFNTVSESNQDLDLGSGGAVLLPDMTDATGAVRHLIVGAGKDKTIYLADRDNLGKFNASTSPADGNIYQKITGQLAGLNYTTPAYFNGALYYGSDGDTLKAFPFANARLGNPTSHSAATFAHPGTTPAVSANGTTNGIVWAVESSINAAAVLHAYDPANLATEFYNSNQAAGGRDAFGNGNKFITPLVVNGKVYVGTQTGVAVFGLLPH